MVANSTGDRNAQRAVASQIFTLRAVLAAAGMTLLLSGCYSGPRLSETVPQTVVEVDNQGFNDMNIFVLPAASQRIRLGLASAKRKTSLDIPARLVTSVRTLRFVATAIATPRGPVSEEVTVTPGDTVVLVIPPH